MQQREAIREALLIKGYNISSWSRENRFSPTYVHKIISMYLSASNPMRPSSPTVYKIIKSIKKDTGVDLLKSRRYGGLI